MPTVLVGEIDQIGSVECSDAPLLINGIPHTNPDQRQRQRDCK